MNRPARARFTAIAPIALSIGVALVLAAAARLARADAQQQQSFRVWGQMADCARLAAKQYPDHTPDGNVKREAARQDCLRQRHLPIVPLTQQPTPPAQ
jgi:hypothetical protein